MQQDATLTRSRLKSPRAAAVAGILFSVLLIISLVLIRVSIPLDPQEAGDWLDQSWRSVNLALNLVPFAGIAFLWFIGVVRDRMDDLEDRLFATVFLGSGLLFLIMLFASAAVAGGLITVYGAATSELIDRDTYSFGRAVTYETLNIYAMKMAGVFMISTSTIAMRTKIFPRWMALLGYALALVLLFPLWVLMISVYILLVNLGRPSAAKIAQAGSVVGIDKLQLKKQGENHE